MSGRYAQLDIWKADLEDSIRNIRAYEKAIAELLIKQGLVKSAADVAILNGLELEITRVYGEKSARKRIRQVLARGIDINDKNEKHMHMMNMLRMMKMSRTQEHADNNNKVEPENAHEKKLK